MEKTHQAERGLALLEYCGVSEQVKEQLVERALGIAAMRHSFVLGYKHLLMAAGLVDPGRTRSGGDVPSGAAGDTAG
jgi:hypothetical protein